MKRSFALLLSFACLTLLGAGSAYSQNTQRKVFSADDVKEIYEKYKQNYPDGLSIYFLMGEDNRPTYKGEGLARLNEKIVIAAANRGASYGNRSFYSFVVDKKGKTRDIEVAGTNERQNQAVLKAIKSSRWTPGKKDGQPVDVLVVSSINIVESGE